MRTIRSRRLLACGAWALLLAAIPLPARAEEVPIDPYWTAGRAALEDGFYELAQKKFEQYIARGSRLVAGVPQTAQVRLWNLRYSWGIFIPKTPVGRRSCPAARCSHLHSRLFFCVWTVSNRAMVSTRGRRHV